MKLKLKKLFRVKQKDPHCSVVVVAAGLAGPVGLAAIFLVFLFSLSDVSAMGVPYLAQHPFPHKPLVEDGVIRRDYRRMSRQPFNIWQRRG